MNISICLRLMIRLCVLGAFNECNARTKLRCIVSNCVVYAKNPECESIWDFFTYHASRVIPEFL